MRWCYRTKGWKGRRPRLRKNAHIMLTQKARCASCLFQNMKVKAILFMQSANVAFIFNYQLIQPFQIAARCDRCLCPKCVLFPYF